MKLQFSVESPRVMLCYIVICIAPLTGVNIRIFIEEVSRQTARHNNKSMHFANLASLRFESHI